LSTATAAIDIWSFGLILYALDTGSPLFDMIRGDGLKTAEAMKDLFEWDEDKKAAKLKQVNDPLARNLLMNLEKPIRPLSVDGRALERRLFPF
jgi:serine/threonine protein kinase